MKRIDRHQLITYSPLTEIPSSNQKILNTYKKYESKEKEKNALSFSQRMIFFFQVGIKKERDCVNAVMMKAWFLTSWNLYTIV